MKYVYRCGNCKEIQEVEKKIIDPHPVRCRCGGDLARVYTPLPVVYRVSGFYATDKNLTPVHPLDYDPQVH